MWTRLTFVIALTASITHAEPFDTKVMTPVNLSGIWALNSELSSGPGSQGSGDPGTSGRRPGGGMGRPGMGGFPMGGPGGRSSGASDDDKAEAEMRARRELMRELMQAPTRLTITQDGTTITFVDPDGAVRKYVANDKNEKHQMNAGTVTTKARWEGTSLVIEFDLTDGVKMTRTFALEADGHQLVVTSKLNQSRSSRPLPPMRTVYDIASDAQPGSGR